MQLRDRVRGGGVPDARGAELPQPARRWPSGSAWCADAVQLLPRMARRHGAHSLSHLRLPPALSAAPLLCCAQCRENAHLRPERHRPEIVNGDKLLGVNHSPFTTYRSSVVVLADRLTPLPRPLVPLQRDHSSIYVSMFNFLGSNLCLDAPESLPFEV